MRKIFTLLLMMLLGIVGEVNATAKQTVVFKGEKTTGNWAENLLLDAALFANLNDGDMIWVRTDNDVEGATTATQLYYQLSVNIRYPWTNLANSYDISSLKYWSIATLTSEQVTNIKASGLSLGGHFAKVLEVAYGSVFDQETASYWDSETSNWSTASFVLGDSWGSRQLKSDPLLSLNVGDRITVNFTTEKLDTDEDRWNATMGMYYTTEWEELYNAPAGGKMSVSFMVNESNLDKITSGNIQIGGKNCNVSSIVIETTNLYYGLNAKYNQIDLTTLNGKTVNIDLTRKFDWNTTICVPFDITDISTTLGNSAKAFEYKEQSGEDLVFTEVGTIEAGKPYLMTFDMSDIEEANKTMTKSFEGVIINTTLTNKTASNLVFKGNYTPGFEMDGKYGVACKQHGENWDWGFYKGGSSSTLPAFSAYIEGVSTTRSFSISTGNGTTSIETLGSIKGEDDGPIYNLMGQKANSVGKGIYIKNGKKYIAR